MATRALQVTAHGVGWTARWFMRIADQISNACGVIAHLLVILLIPVGFLNVLLRYLGRFLEYQLSNSFWVETQWYLYGMSFLLMFPYMLYNNQNLRVSFWYDRRSPRTKGWIDLIGHLLSVIPYTVLGVWIAWRPVVLSWSTWEHYPDPGGLPLAPIKAFIIVGFALLGIQTLALMVRLGFFLVSRAENFDETLTKHYEPVGQQ